MTISTETRSAGPFAGNGTTTEFAFTFKVFAASEVVITRKTVATGDEETLTQGSNLVVTLNADQDDDPGGTVTYTPDGAAMSSAYTLTIASDVEATQTVNIVNNDGFFPRLITRALDKLTILTQQIRSRALMIPAGDSASGNMTLPANRYGKYINFDEDNQPILVEGTGTATDAQLVTYTPAGTGAVATTVQTELRRRVNVAQFDALGDDTTVDYPAIANALAYLISLGGGDLYFPNTSTNKYYLGATPTGSVSLPVLTDTGTAFTAVNTSLQYHFYYLALQNIRFIGDGITLRSGVTNGGYIMLLNGPRDIVLDGVQFESVMTFNSGTGAVTQAGMNALGLASTTQDAERIRILNYRATNCYSALGCFGDGASAYRVRGVKMDNALCVGGEYGLAFQDNGDNVDFKNVRVINHNARAYFAFGVKGHTGKIHVSDPGYNNLFGNVLIKAYDYNTSDIDVKVILDQKTNGGIPQVAFQSQHYPATQPTPAVVRNVTVNMDDSGNTGSSVGFDYFKGATSSLVTAGAFTVGLDYQITSVGTTNFVAIGAASNTVGVRFTATGAGSGTGKATLIINSKIFTAINLAGVIYDGSTVTTNVVQNMSNLGLLNCDGLAPITGALSIVRNKYGFYRYPYSTYTPTITIGGSSAGITYSGQLGEYWVVGDRIKGTARVTLSSKGGLTGAVVLILPTTVADTAVPPVITGFGIANMAALNGPITGYLATASDQCVLLDQGAAATANIDGGTNLTNTSQFFVSFDYTA
jgi:hypothetical protein